ncbi:flagellar protein FlgN [Shewanella submarina]|uniref:Flagellar export chaperone FlgN n=1 Tax=Shewanella submarina TaxID=2016376 RepID=A0ABV7GCM4_9GAMM|nr:flagellar protein FlgN [Shewanella submarina]MCL1038738.1 flagellar protein FlgN [Shewanella submarina]
MAGKKELLQALIRGIRRDLADYARLQELLTAQRQLMLGRDNDGLVEHNRVQDQLVAQLAQSASQRSQLLQRIGVTADAAGVEKLLKAMPASVAGQVQTMWQRLMALGAECQAANEQNGRLLVRQQELIRDLLQQSPSSQTSSLGY